VIEPWRAAAFPLIKDLSSIAAPSTASLPPGGYISVSTGNATDGNTHSSAKTSPTARWMRRLYRLRSLRRRLPKCLLSALHRSPRLPISASCRKASRNATAAHWGWLRK